MLNYDKLRKILYKAYFIFYFLQIVEENSIIFIVHDYCNFKYQSKDIFNKKKWELYLFWKPGCNKWHLKSVCIRVKRVKRVRIHGANHCHHSTWEMVTNCKSKWTSLLCVEIYNNDGTTSWYKLVTCRDTSDAIFSSPLSTLAQEDFHSLSAFTIYYMEHKSCTGIYWLGVSLQLVSY